MPWPIDTFSVPRAMIVLVHHKHQVFHASVNVAFRSDPDAAKIQHLAFEFTSIAEQSFTDYRELPLRALLVEVGAVTKAEALCFRLFISLFLIT